MDDEQELTSDELWQEAQEDEALPDDDSDLEADGLEEGTDEDGDGDGTTSRTDAPAQSQSQLDKEALYQEFAARFEKEKLPARDEQLAQSVQNRLQQSIKDRDANIKRQLAPLAKYLQGLQTQGFHTPEEASKEYQKAYQELAAEQSAQEQQQQQAGLYQKWLASRQPSQSSAPEGQVQPQQVRDWEALMTQRIQTTTLADDDPEWKQMPLEQQADGSFKLKVTHANPQEAFAYVRSWMETLEQQKAQRLAQTAPKAQRKNLFPVDMGGGGSVGAGSTRGIEDTDQLWSMAMGEG